MFAIIYPLAKQKGRTDKPLAQKGVLDLRSWDLQRDGNISLNGEWAFSWNDLASPRPSASSSADFIKVPGIWNNHVSNGQKDGAEGFATYSLDVRLQKQHEMLALNILTVSNAYDLFVNGKKIASNGTVGKDEETSKPAYAPQVVTFIPDSDCLHFVMHISNFAHCKGGFWLPVEIGTVKQIHEERDSRVLLEMFLFGCLFIMALYHFSLYLLRRSDPSTLYFGLMCVIIGVRSLFTGENLVNDLYPGIDWFFARKIEFLLTFLSAPVYITFARALYRREWNTTVYRIAFAFGMALCLFVLVTPARIFTLTSYVFTGYAWITSMYTIFVFIKAMKRKENGAGIFLATSLFFLLTIVNDTLNQLELVHTGLYLSFGLLVVTFAQSFVISSRFANAFRTTEIYASTFRKFVPAQFLDKIAKDGIESIRAGYAQREEVAVLFSDIRSFTSLAEKMSSDEVFRMLNEYLAYVEPPIRAHSGFVDKYMGDGIMALFENGDGNNSCDNAVAASLEMLEQLEAFNEKRISAGEEPLRMGIGLHNGPVIIGTLGGNERMDSTAIGDAVNLTSRIEGMTKMYGVPLLAGESIIRALSIRHELYCRFVDTVVAKGKNEPVAIWEISGRRSDKRLAAYAKLIPAYEEAIRFFRERKIADAKKEFEKCLALFPGDTVSRIYLDRCTKFLETGVDENVSGITSLDSK
ncbi:MAG TPA: adenylate/guanylate cyclase domain-containing protein [Bacteroidia bacterium]|nr:adenylate/guanylate cyclase domain-containing protein [Bacteroidia bacterium]